jgi:uncharacterized protein YndB with AHSA1/START domain
MGRLDKSKSNNELVWSDPKGKGLKAELDVRPGGYFEITFQDSDRTEHTCSGFYDEVRVLSKLTFSWQWFKT